MDSGSSASGCLLEDDVEVAGVAGAADRRRCVVASFHRFNVAAQVLAQIIAPGALEQAHGEHGGVDDVFRRHAQLGNRFVVRVDAGCRVTEAHVPGAVQDHGVEHLVHLAFKHHEGLGPGNRAGGVPLDEGFNQTLRFLRVGRALFTHQLTDDRAEVLLGHDLREQCASGRAVRPVLQRYDRTFVIAGRPGVSGRRVGCVCMHAITPSKN